MSRLIQIDELHANHVDRAMNTESSRRSGSLVFHVSSASLVEKPATRKARGIRNEMIGTTRHYWFQAAPKWASDREDERNSIGPLHDYSIINLTRAVNSKCPLLQPWIEIRPWPSAGQASLLLKMPNYDQDSQFSIWMQAGLNYRVLASPPVSLTDSTIYINIDRWALLIWFEAKLSQDQADMIVSPLSNWWWRETFITNDISRVNGQQWWT